MGGVLVKGVSEAGALSYKKYQRVDFIFDPTIEVNISGDLAITNLSPGQGKDSNIISVQTGTNVSSGMLLTATVGRNNGNNDPYNTTGLVNGNNSFTALTSAVASFAGFSANEWGYSYCTKGLEICTSDDPEVISDDDWVSGNVGSTTNGYAGLPLHSATGIQLASVSGNTQNTLQFKIGAKAGNSQASGEYTNIVNFKAVTNIVTTDYDVNFLNGSGATGMPGNVSDIASIDTNVRLGSGQDQTDAPTKEGYVFKGWCTVQTSSDACSGNVYLADETYPIINVGTTSGNPLVVNLYAMWEANAS